MSHQLLDPPTVVDTMTRWATQAPERPAIIGFSTVTWGELADRSRHCAARLRAEGIRPGDRVGCLLPNDERYYIAFLAIVGCGAIVVPLNTLHHPTELAWVMENAAPSRVISTPELIDRLPSTSRDAALLLELLPEPGSGGAAPEEKTGVRPTLDDPAAILYTSGTTGQPKGALFTHRAFATTAMNMIDRLRLTADDRHLVVSPLAFTGGLLTGSQAALFSGATILIQDGFDPDQLLERIERERPTVFMAVPAMLARLRDRPAYHPHTFTSLRYLGCGSAPVPAPLLAAYQEDDIPIGHAYGFTEGGGLACMMLPGQMSARPGSVGRACAYTEIRIDRPAGTPDSAPGEIQQRGPGVMREYWRNPEATAAAIKDGWVRSGDLGVIDDAGFVTVVGRTKDLIITGGMNVYPAEVESALAEHASVIESAVVGVSHPTYGETVVAVVVSSDPMLSLETIREHCAERLAGYKVPRELWLVDQLPRTSSGKVLKNALRPS